MGRARRIHVPDGIYYVQLRVNSGQHLVRDAQDAAELSQQTAKAAALCNVLIHAYSWRLARADLLVQIAQAPLGYAMQLISGPFAQRVQARRGLHGPLFQRYRAVLVSNATQLLQLVRYIHQLPVKEGLVQRPEDYAWSSHHDYAGMRRTSWLTTSLVRQLLAGRIGRGKEAYVRWMAEPVSERLARLFETARVSLPAYAAQPLEPTRGSGEAARAELTVESLGPIIEIVARALDVTRAQVLSRSCARQVTLARALISWNALREGRGTLAEVGRCLNRDSSTLSRAIDRCRTRRADLFNKSLRELASLRPGDVSVSDAERPLVPARRARGSEN